MRLGKVIHGFVTGAVLSVGVFPGSALAQYGATDGEWSYYGGDAGSTKYAPLDQINGDNFNDLEVAWTWQTENFGPRPENYYRVTPIMVNGVLYATAGSRRAVVAIDPTTGETLWVYRYDEGRRGEAAPRLNSGRGVAYWEDPDNPADRRILLITPGYQLVALDADTGQPIPGFGANGWVDLKQGLDREVDPIDGAIGSSSPPIVSRGVIVVGAALIPGTAPESRDNVPGHIRGYDVRTGERKWIFHTIPHPGEFGNDTWEDGSWEYTGNAGVWPPFSVDHDLGYVYLPTELGTGDYYGGHRLGDNLFSNSLVCLDVETGERVWHFQMIHHGIWDWDNPAPPILLDVTVDGRPRKIVVQVTKQAWAYVFDRETGEPIWPIEERPVAQTDVPGERTSPTQPFPTKPLAYDLQGFTLDDLIDFTPELRQEAFEIVSQYRLGPIFTPPSLIDAEDGTKGTIQVPNQTGGTNWTGATVDPETGVLFVPSYTSPSLRALTNDPTVSDMDFIDAGRIRGPRGLPIVRPPWGRITAIDLNTGDHIWMVANSDTPETYKNNPALRGLDIEPTGTPTWVGAITTKTLLIAGAGGGFRLDGEPVLRALDKTNGAVLGKVDLPGVTCGVPMTYMADDKQYVVTAVCSRQHPAQLVALTLP